jgi:hypothetical protein
MEPEISLQYSQEPTTCPYSETDKSTSNLTTLFLYDPS